MATKKKVKVRDLKPSKDAKGGGTHASGIHASGTHASGTHALGTHQQGSHGPSTGR